MALNPSIELSCCREVSELGALPDVSVMPDLSCHRQAIISAAERSRQGCKDPALLLLPLQSSFPHRACDGGTGSSNFPSAGGRRQGRPPGCRLCFPASVPGYGWGSFCPALASAEADSWHEERDGGRAAGACAASLSPLQLPAVFHGIISESYLSRGSMGQLQARLLPVGLCLEEDAKCPDAGRSRNMWQGTVSTY